MKTDDMTNTNPTKNYSVSRSLYISIRARAVYICNSSLYPVECFLSNINTKFYL